VEEPKPIKLKSCPKKYYYGTHRVVSPEDTLKSIEDKLSIVGASDVRDLTPHDRIGIPVFSCRRVTAAPGASSIHSGKGLTHTQAKVSLLMEVYERYSAEPRGDGVITASYHEVKGSYPALRPSSLNPPRWIGDVDNVKLRWTWGWDIMRDEPILVPLNCVFHPYYPRDDVQVFRTNTNGLASGNTIEEAILHAVLELIERDAWSIAEFTRRVGDEVDPSSDPLTSQVLSMFEEAGVKVTVRDITSDVGVTVVAAVSEDLKVEDPALLTIGLGCHLNPTIAVLRSLTEVAQSRIMQLHGGGRGAWRAELLRQLGVERVKRINRHWFEEAPNTKVVGELKRMDTDDILADLKRVLDLLRKAGFEHVAVVDLTRPEIGIPTVRVVIPGIEEYALDPERVGSRCLGALKR